MTNPDTSFWDIVAEPAKPGEYTAGTLVLVEQGKRQSYHVITETWIDGHGNSQARLRDATPEELTALETGTRRALVIVVPS